MIIATPEPDGIETVAVEDLLKSLESHFPGAQVTFVDGKNWVSRTALYDIIISPRDESSFSVTCHSHGHGFSIDGLESQDARAAIARREAWRTDRRIVAADSSGILVCGSGPWYVPGRCHKRA